MYFSDELKKQRMKKKVNRALGTCGILSQKYNIHIIVVSEREEKGKIGQKNI